MADIIGIDHLKKTLSKYTFFKIKVTKGSETLHYDYIRGEDETQEDLVAKLDDFFVDALEINPNNTREYLISLYGNTENDPTKKTNKPFVQFKFQLNNRELTSIAKAPASQVPSDYIEMVREVERLKYLNERLSDELMQIEEEEEDEVGAVEDPMMAMQNMLMGKLPQILDYILKPNASPKIAGIESEGSTGDVIAELEQYDPELESDLKKLLSLAKNNPSLFKMLLNSLRSM
jgi:hypothetical protein